MPEWIFLISHLSSMCFCANPGSALSLDGKSIRTASAKVTLSHGSEDQENNEEKKGRKAMDGSI